MERLRKSFRRKGKQKESGMTEMKEETDVATVSEMSTTGEGDIAPPSRLTRLRQSLRIKNKKKKVDEPKIEEDPDDQIQIEPFDKKLKFRRSLSFRKKKNKSKKKEKPVKFENDEDSVRAGRCTFAVKYLGSIEVLESRGMEVCEAAVKQLKKSKKKPISSILHVSGDGLRVVEKKSSGMLVDQVIEKVSFCSPDRNCEKGFAYICRDGTTRRWLCHAFLAKEDSGERISHAVGVAFSICLERKQQRESDCGVSMSYNESDGTFTKFGSFRQGTISERIQDPQIFKPSSPPPVQKVENPHAVARPHVTDLMFQRQASFKGLASLAGNSPFKRGVAYSSLRETSLPSTVQRKEKSRISLILEENFEDEELKNEINNLMNKMTVERFSNKGNNNNSNNINNNGGKGKGEPDKQVARVQPVQLQEPRPFPYISPSPEIIKFAPAVPDPLPSTLNPSPSSATEQANTDIPFDKNPWDLVPDQSKFKHHSRSNSKTENIRDNPADNWLASLTSKISDIEDNNVTYGFQGSDHEEDLDKEFAQLAKRNTLKNTNPFKAVL